MAFSYSAAITVDHTKVPNTDQTGFPVLVFGTYAGTAGVPDLRVAGSGGHVQHASGYDIYFYSDSGLTTRIPAERVTWNSSTGAIQFWVKRSLLTASDVTIYIAYGDSGISSDPNSDATYGRTSVWDTNYKGVWHLDDVTAGGTTIDSTSNGNTGTASATSPTSSASGQIGNCANFDGNTARNIDVGSSTSLGGLAAFTISGWIKPSGFGDDTFSTIFCIAKQRSPAPLDPFQDIILAVQSGALFLGASSGVAGSRKTYNPATTLTTGNWYHVVGVYNGSNLNTYKNGTLVGAGIACTVTTPSTPSQSARIGQMGIAVSDFAQVNGLLEEVRVSNIQRTADWILTEYNNQNSPSTFYTMGPETAISSGHGTYNLSALGVG